MNCCQQTELTIDHEERRRAPAYPVLLLILLGEARPSLLAYGISLDERFILCAHHSHDGRLDLEGQAKEGGAWREGIGGRGDQPLS